jgi:hypothetical protein
MPPRMRRPAQQALILGMLMLLIRTWRASVLFGLGHGLSTPGLQSEPECHLSLGTSQCATAIVWKSLCFSEETVS